MCPLLAGCVLPVLLNIIESIYLLPPRRALVYKTSLKPWYDHWPSRKYGVACSSNTKVSNKGSTNSGFFRWIRHHLRRSYKMMKISMMMMMTMMMCDVWWWTIWRIRKEQRFQPIDIRDKRFRKNGIPHIKILCGFEKNDVHVWLLCVMWQGVREEWCFRFVEIFGEFEKNGVLIKKNKKICRLGNNDILVWLMIDGFEKIHVVIIKEKKIVVEVYIKEDEKVLHPNLWLK